MNIPNHDIEELLRKYHAGHISKEEFDRLKETVNRLEDEELKFFIGQHWDSYTDESPLPEAKKARIYQALERKIRVPMHIRLRTHWAQIAASLLLVLSVGLSVLFYSQHQELQQLTSRNVVIRSGESPSSVTLPDGTKVKLNTHSSLTYQQDFGREDRRVSLSGEGYFDVKRDEAKQFTVQTGFIDITVLGTSFNVYAYEDKDFLEMALIEGSVCVNTTQPPYETLHARPNEKITYNKHTGELSLESTSNRAETAWMNDTLTFRHTPLHEVFASLERKFQVTVSLSDTTFLNDTYTGTFKESSVEDILSILKQHYGFAYTHTGDSIHIDMRQATEY